MRFEEGNEGAYGKDLQRLREIASSLFFLSSLLFGRLTVRGYVHYLSTVLSHLPQLLPKRNLSLEKMDIRLKTMRRSRRGDLEFVEKQQIKPGFMWLDKGF